MNQEIINKFYSPFVQFCDPYSVESLGWTSEENQNRRFNIIKQIGIKNSDSVLDVGCGYGDFSKFLGEKYCGIDLRQHAIDGAAKKYPGKRFITGDINSLDEKFDWVVASGIFCHDYDKWEEDTLKTLEKMFSLCNKGIAANFLADSVKEPGEDLKYTNTSEITSKFVHKISPYFIVRQDYGIDDITIYLYKYSNS